MPQINILSREIAELIAAGEVVERPASVIKELVENCVDAGATSVTVEIMNGGVSFMRVTDNGFGIAFDEVPKAFLRHATSKTSDKKDLENIITMGFRGEALASIAAVSKTEMLTKRAKDEKGALYKIHGGEEKSHIETGCPDGTTVIVRELFYNTPARLKFLKKDVSEANAVQGIVDKLILASPNIAFKFIRDNKIIRITAGDGELYSAIYSVFGKQFAASLVPVNFSQWGVKISGYISSALFCRGNRAMQYFYLNSRPIKSLKIMAALEEAYKNAAPTGKYPACVLQIEMNPAEVDVNVHPAKTEVRFANENAVFDTVYFAVKNALLNARNVKEIEIAKNPKPEYRPALFSENNSRQQDFKTTLNASAAEFKVINNLFPEVKDLKSPQDFQNIKKQEIPKKEYVHINQIHENITSSTFPAPTGEKAENKSSPQSLRVIGELWKTYIICETRESESKSEKENLVLIDKHAAHERIHFESLKKELVSSSQLLAESIYLKFDMRLYDALTLGRDVLLSAGIEIIPGENYTIEIISLPAALINGDTEGILSGAAEIFANRDVFETRETGETGKIEKVVTEGIFSEILHSIACKSAVKAGDKSLNSDLEILANTVWSDKNIRFCPHGRPVVSSISRREIEKNFGRI